MRPLASTVNRAEAIGSHRSVGLEFYPGWNSRCSDFKDYDGQGSGQARCCTSPGAATFYDGGHTLKFAERTIRLPDAEEHQAITADTGNALFRSLGR